MFSDRERAELYRKLAVQLWLAAEQCRRSARRERLMRFVGKYERIAAMLENPKATTSNVVPFARPHEAKETRRLEECNGGFPPRSMQV